MNFASLGSGSSGNATLVRDRQTLVLVDCGFSVKEVERRMQPLGVNAGDISAILVTHEHSDHISGVGVLAKKYGIPVYMTDGTRANKVIKQPIDIQIIRDYRPFSINTLTVFPVVVPHDAKEPAQYVFENEDGLRLGILTDLGSITPHVVNAYRRCHGLLVEANHDLEMLADGPYPPALKSRVASDWGHLNNRQTAQLLRQLDLDHLQQLVIGHISQKNNSLDCVQRELSVILPRVKSIHYATQNSGFDWLHLEAPPALDLATAITSASKG